MKIYDASGFDSSLTGSFSGSFFGDGSNLTGIVTYTRAEISGSSTILSASLANTITDIVNGNTTVVSASRAITASYALNAGAGSGFPFSGSANITGSLYVSGGSISGSFVGDGSGITGLEVSEIATVTDTFTAQSSVNVLHGFGTKNVIVQVYEGDTIINPDSITTTDDNNVLVNFGTPRTGRVVVAKGGHRVVGTSIIGENTVVDTFTNETTITTVHNFGTKNVIAQVYLDDDSQIIPASLVTTDTNTIVTTLDQSRSGRVVVGKAGHIISSSAVASSINFNNIFDKPTLISSSAQIDLISSSSYSITSSFSSIANTAITASNADISTTVHNTYLLSGSIQFWSGPKQVYDSISSSADPNTIYFVTE